MITHRMTTRMQPEPPVRFYRTIAITFLVLTIVLLAVVVFFTSKKATVVIVAKSDNKNVNLSIDVSDSNVAGKAIKGIVTSTDFVWSEKYYPTSNKVIDGVATGQITIYNDSGLVQPLVKTTRFLTSKGILFRLSEGATVPANGKITANVYADQAGASGDINPSDFTIPGLTLPRQKLIYGKSASKMDGGVRKVGVLSSGDLQAAKSNYLLKAKQAYDKNNQSKYTDKERVVLVKDSGVVTANKEVGSEIDQFILSGTSTVVSVYYDKSELQTIVSQELSKKIDTNSEKVLSVGKIPQVSVDNYNLNLGTARLSVYQDVLVTLDANGSKMAAINFFDKDKDEIQRFVMGLGHVVGVEVKFSPSWMRKAPSASDRIKVVVKNVK